MSSAIASAVKLPLVDLERQYLSIKGEIDAALLDGVASTQFVLGDELVHFEEEFATYCGARYCVGVGWEPRRSILRSKP